jgi:ribonuclease HI
VPGLDILVDSSTTRTSRRNRYGRSVAAWGAWIEGDDEGPIRSGVHYFRHFGPNKAFYEGVIRALEGCLQLGAIYSPFTVYGDCQPVLFQLMGFWAVGDLKPWYERAQSLEAQIPAPVRYAYLSEEDARYRKVDQLSKRAKKFIHNELA